MKKNSVNSTTELNDYISAFSLIVFSVWTHYLVLDDVEVFSQAQVIPALFDAAGKNDGLFPLCP